MYTNSYVGLMDDLVRRMMVGHGALRLANPADKFAGKWTGTMYFANSSGKANIVVTLLTGCKPGDVCGLLENKTSDFICELTLDEVNGDVLSYTFSKSLRGEGPMGSFGKLILRPDGTLYRVHQTPDSIVSGTLTRK
jgi:hypothetical protein